jgi:hypothetical protein
VWVTHVRDNLSVKGRGKDPTLLNSKASSSK